MSELTNRVRNIPPEMLLDIAAGIEEPVDIAFRYGFSASEYIKLSQSQEFLREINIQRAENDRTGVTARNKAGLFYDVLADAYFKRLLAEDVSVAQLAAGVDTFATLGGRKPKNDAVGMSGAQFSITFNIPNAAAMPQIKDINQPVPKKEAILSGISFGVTDVEDTDGESEE
ncbi:hypothetical protein ACO0LG_08650 [Undibacterium sp. Ji42W]|uniref:hypothetical protein n=1 Tax=Undibacterium sp. Ji42W TaxID=3413039 RepID=UPI003BF43C57